MVTIVEVTLINPPGYLYTLDLLHFLMLDEFAASYKKLNFNLFKENKDNMNILLTGHRQPKDVPEKQIIYGKGKQDFQYKFTKEIVGIV